ncbi:hypothetical protein WDU94_012584 [Cyamophila willieti]
MYQRLEKDNVEVGDELKQSLLELVCYYNCEDSLPEDLLEERWFTQSKHLVPKHNMWKDNDFAETLFKSFPEPGAAQYASIIQGMLKYNQVERALSLFEEAKGKGLTLPVFVYNLVERALSLFEEAKGKGLTLPVFVYNLVLGKVNFVKEGFEHRMQMIIDVLTEMNVARISPTVDTLNEILNQLSLMASFRDSKKMALKTLSEMRKFGVKPSLASYNHETVINPLWGSQPQRVKPSLASYNICCTYSVETVSKSFVGSEPQRVKPSLASYNHLLYLFCRDRGPTSGILYSILDELESRVHSGETIHVQDMRDNQFFSGAMEIARRHLSDVSCAYRIDKLLHIGHNYNFIGESTRESAYYRNFFFLVMSREPLLAGEKLMMELIKTADLNGKIEFFPRLWSELNMLELWQQEDLLSYFVESLNRNLIAAPAELVPQLADVVWSVYSKVVEQNDMLRDGRSKVRSIEWTGVTLGHMMSVLLADSRLKEVNILVGYYGRPGWYSRVHHDGNLLH